MPAIDLSDALVRRDYARSARDFLKLVLALESKVIEQFPPETDRMFGSEKWKAWTGLRGVRRLPPVNDHWRF